MQTKLPNGERDAAIKKWREENGIGKPTLLDAVMLAQHKAICTLPDCEGDVDWNEPKRRKIALAAIEAVQTFQAKREVTDEMVKRAAGAIHLCWTCGEGLTETGEPHDEGAEPHDCQTWAARAALEAALNG